MIEYSVEIVGRGEEVVYRDGDRSLCAQIAIRGAKIEFDAYTVGVWQRPGGVSLSSAEKALAIERITAYLATRCDTIQVNEQEPPVGPPPGRTGRDAIEYRRRMGIERGREDDLFR